MQKTSFLLIPMRIFDLLQPGRSYLNISPFWLAVRILSLIRCSLKSMERLLLSLVYLGWHRELVVRLCKPKQSKALQQLLLLPVKVGQAWKVREKTDWQDSANERKIKKQLLLISQFNFAAQKKVYFYHWNVDVFQKRLHLSEVEENFSAKIRRMEEFDLFSISVRAVINGSGFPAPAHAW